MASNLSFGSGVVELGVFTSSPGHVSTLSGPGNRPYPAGYTGTDGGVAAHLCPVFPMPFGRRHSLLGHPVPAEGSASLTVGPPASSAAGTRRGSTFHTSKKRPGWAPPIPRGRWCPPGRRLVSQPAPATSQRPVPSSRWHIPSAGPKRDEASSGDSLAFTRPVFPLPVTPDGTRVLGLLP
jgi:hypothetical protein